MKELEPLQMRERVFRAGDDAASPNLMGHTLFQNWLYGYGVIEEAEKEWAKLTRHGE